MIYGKNEKIVQVIYRAIVGDNINLSEWHSLIINIQRIFGENFSVCKRGLAVIADLRVLSKNNSIYLVNNFF